MIAKLLKRYRRWKCRNGHVGGFMLPFASMMAGHTVECCFRCYETIHSPGDPLMALKQRMEEKG